MPEQQVDLKEMLLSYSNRLKTSKSEMLDGTITVKLTGVSFDGRQENIKKVFSSTPLRLTRDRRNEHDNYAVMVEANIDEEWKEVGFIPAKYNKPIALAIDGCIDISIRLDSKYGGDKGYVYGMSVVLTTKKEI
jgi:hypothetical protein